MDEWFEAELHEAIRNPWRNAMGRAYAKAAREELDRRERAWDALFAQLRRGNPNLVYVARVSNNNGSP